MHMNNHHAIYSNNSSIDTDDDKFTYQTVCIGIVCKISQIASGDGYMPSSAEY